MKRSEQFQHWCEEIITPQVLTDELRESFTEEGCLHIEKLEEALEIAIYTLNNIANQRGVGPGGESSYDVISKIQKLKK